MRRNTLLRLAIPSNTLVHLIRFARARASMMMKRVTVTLLTRATLLAPLAYLPYYIKPPYPTNHTNPTDPIYPAHAPPGRYTWEITPGDFVVGMSEVDGEVTFYTHCNTLVTPFVTLL
jgi:hypothetical protein